MTFEGTITGTGTGDIKIVWTNLRTNKQNEPTMKFFGPSSKTRHLSSMPPPARPRQNRVPRCRSNSACSGRDRSRCFVGCGHGDAGLRSRHLTGSAHALHPVIGRVHSFDDVHMAYRSYASNAPSGKVVIQISN